MLTKPLHPYQDPAVDQFLGRGSLLIAYEMGLGKTPIAIACAEELLGCRDIATCLVVCPASLKYHWGQKLAEFTDMPSVPLRIKQETITVPSPMSCTIIDGTPDKRRKQYAEVLRRRPEYVVLSYENVLNDARFVRQINPGLTILDECSAIKTFQAKRTKRIKQMLASEYRLGLTGTPVENRPEELYSIMQWVDDTALGRFDLFERAYINRDRYGRVRSYKNLPVLRKRIAPALARKSRLDPDVAAYLPDVDSGEWYVEMGDDLADAYVEVAGDLHRELKSLPASGGFDMAAYYAGTMSYSESSALGRVMARQQALEMLLDHPLLVQMSGDHYERSVILQDEGVVRKDWPGSAYCADLAIEWADSYPKDTPKLDLLTEKVPAILDFDTRNKILIFTRYRGMLDIISDALPCQSVQFHGGMNPKEKTAAIAEFTSNDTTRVFLSSHAGAYGNDMHMANYLINYDLPWSAGRADQINGRHVRASSSFRSVFVRNIIVRGSIEERRLALLAFKRKVGSAILDGHGEAADGTISNDLESLLAHLTSVLGRTV